MLIYLFASGALTIKKKVRVLDSALNTLIGKEIDIKDEGADMQDFKELLKNKFEK